jgi:hypothetical protein
MDSIDSIRERVEALEQQTKVMEAHTRTVEQRLRWWRGMACGALMLAVLALTLPSGKAVDAQPGGLPERVAALEDKFAAFTFDAATNEVAIGGANLRIVNGLGTTDTANELGNLIVGYNESREGSMECLTAPTSCQDTRTGSHNIVVGRLHNFSSFGGLVAGRFNEISGQFTSVSGGSFNTASGLNSSVSGGRLNTASAEIATVSGGFRNTASGSASSVGGGAFNRASASDSSVIGGAFNRANGATAAISGGQRNTASGVGSSVSGGENNTASGDESSVSGGRYRTAPAPFNWAAGPFLADE